MPTVAVNAAGWRIEPPVSVAVAPMQSSAATADADPPDEPPGTSVVLLPPRRQGLPTGPKHEVSFDEPIANSSLLSLPSITGLGERHQSEIGHLLIGLQKNGESVLSLAGSSFLARSRSTASSWSSTAS